MPIIREEDALVADVLNLKVNDAVCFNTFSNDSERFKIIYSEN